MEITAHQDSSAIDMHFFYDISDLKPPAHVIGGMLQLIHSSQDGGKLDQHRKNATETATRWQHFITSQQRAAVEMSCSDWFKDSGYNL